MDKFQEIIEEMQLAVLDVFNNITVLLNSEKRTSDEKVKLLKEYVKEQSSILCSDIAIHNDADKIIELFPDDQSEK